MPIALSLLALATACAALARPRARTVVANERATVILVIDTSRSMQSMDVRPSRLAAAEEAARIFVERVPKRLRIGLIAFAGDVQVVSVPTRDHRLVLQSLDSIGSVSQFGGTAIGHVRGQRAFPSTRSRSARRTPTRRTCSAASEVHGPPIRRRCGRSPG